MTFAEFLDAVGKSQLRILLEETDFEPIAKAFHTELIDLLKMYYFVGGMPEAVAQFVKNQDLHKVRRIQKKYWKRIVLTFLNILQNQRL